MSNLKKIIWYGGYSYLLMPITLGTNILLRRWLDPYEVGVINILVLLSTYSLYSNIGLLSQAEIRLPYLNGSSRINEYKELDFYAYKASLLGGLLFSAIAVSIYYLLYEEAHPKIEIPVIIYCLYIIYYQLASYYITKHRTNGNFIFLAKYQFIVSAASNLSILIASLFWGVLGYVISATGLMILQVKYLKTNTPKIVALEFKFKKFINQIKLSRRILLLGFSALLIRNFDGIIVGFILGPADLGYYSLATIGVTIIFSITNSIGNVLFPPLQNALAKDCNDSGWSAYHKYITVPLIGMALILPLGIGGLHYIIPSLIAWIAPTFVPGIQAFQVLIWGAYYFSLMNILAAYFNSSGKQIEVLKIYFASMFLTFTSVGLLCGREIKILDIAFATAFCYAAAYFLMFFKYANACIKRQHLKIIGLTTLLPPCVALLNIKIVDYLSIQYNFMLDSYGLSMLIVFGLMSMAEIFLFVGFSSYIKNNLKSIRRL